MYDIRNFFAPSIGSPGLSVFVEAGTLLVSGSPVVLGSQTVSLPANSTNFVYLNTNTAVVTTTTGGFPSTNCYPISTVVTGTSGVVSLTDNRPDVGGTGGGSGAVTSVFGRTGAVVAVATDYGTVGIDGQNNNLTIKTTNVGSITLTDTNESLTIGPAGSGATLGDAGGNAFTVTGFGPGATIELGSGPPSIFMDSGDSIVMIPGSPTGEVNLTATQATFSNNIKSNAVINAVTGYQVNSVAPSGQFLRGNGTNFVSSAIQAGDLPAGTGTVTSFSAGNIGAIATTSVATPTTTPALTFSLSTQTANTVWAGPTTGSAAVPTFRALVSADLPAGTGTVTSFSAGNLSPLFTTSVATATTTPALSFSLSNAGGGTVYGNNTTGSAAPAFTTAPVLGIPGTSTGSVALASSTASGKFTVTAPASAATPTLTLPTTSNVLAGQFAGDNVIYTSILQVASAAGTLTPSLLTQTANTVFAGPTTGAAATPTFRALVTADLPAGTGTVTSVSGTANQIASTGGATPVLSITNPFVFPGPASIGANYISETRVVNTGSTTTAGLLVRNTVLGNVQTVLTSAIDAFGVAITSQTAGQNVEIALTGIVTVVADNTITIGNLMVPGTVTAGRVSDSGQASPLAISNQTQIVGRALSSATAGGTFTMQLFGPGIFGEVIPTGTITWDQIGNAAATLTLANGAFNTNIQNTGSSNFFQLINTTAATSGASHSSTQFQLAGRYWTGASSAIDTWTIQDVLANGTNGASTLTFSHSGTTGAQNIAFGTSAPSGSTITFGTSNGILTLGTGAVWSIANANFAGIQGANTLAVVSGAGGIDFSNDSGATAGVILSSNKLTKYNSISTVRGGVGAEYASSDLTAQSAAIAATTLYATTATGAYRVDWSAAITTAATTSSVLGGTNGFQVLYTSPTDSVVKTTVSGASVTSAANTTGTATSGSLICYAKTGTNIQFTYDYTSVGVTAMQFELHITVTAL